MKSSVKLGLFIAILTVISFIVGWNFYPKPDIDYEGFEKDFGGWVEGADVPQDPNNPGSLIDWSVSRVISPVKSGQYSVELYIDGRQDDGTVWIERKLSVSKNARIQVKFTFDFYSESESFNVIASIVSFIGKSNPEVEEDFTVLGQANQFSGWKSYTLKEVLNTDSSVEVWVAVGISVRWETEMTYNLDNLKITIN